MKILIAEDDFASRILLQELLKSYGPQHVVVNGREAVEAVALALAAFEPYDLICLDIMMPEMDGQQALLEIRAIEASSGIKRKAKIIMTTALADQANVEKALREHCDSYIAKPIRKEVLTDQLRMLSLIG